MIINLLTLSICRHNGQVYLQLFLFLQFAIIYHLGSKNHQSNGKKDICLFQNFQLYFYIFVKNYNITNILNLYLN